MLKLLKNAAIISLSDIHHWSLLKYFHMRKELCI